MGSLLGLAIGDAVGFAVEGAVAAAARTYADQLGPALEGARAHPGFSFGQYSDDTILARELVAAAMPGRVDLDRFVQGCLAAHRDGGIVGAGPGTTGTLERILAGVPWQEAATPAPYAGNGAAMRAGPLGALFADTVALAGEAAMLQARLTHADPRAVAGAGVVARAVAVAARPGPLDADRFLAEVDGDECLLPRAELLGWLRLPLEAAAARARRLDEGPRGAGAGLSPCVVPTVAWALFSFLRSPDDYAETIRTAIWIGGDTDTLGAMAGAISGARVGLAALPPRLIAVLHDRGRWTGPELVALAESALTRVGSGA